MTSSNNTGREEDEWLELLAGRKQGVRSSRDLRQAVQLREYFMRLDDWVEQSSLDGGAQARMLARLREAGLLATPEESASGRATMRPAATRARWRVLIEWFSASFKSAGWGHVAVACVCMTVALTVPPSPDAPPAPDMPQAIPGPLPDIVTKGFKARPVQSTRIILAKDPAALAADIAGMLREAGVEARIEGRGGVWEVRAFVPGARRKLVGERLAKWGIVPANDGTVSVEIKAL